MFINVSLIRRHPGFPAQHLKKKPTPPLKTHETIHTTGKAEDRTGEATEQRR